MKNKLPVIIVAVILAAALCFSVIFISTSKSRTQKIGDKVEIVSDGKTLYTLDLGKEKDRTFKIKYSGGGSNTVEIKDGKIRISEADCPDKVCVKHSWLESKDLPIVCLPHKLIIRFTEDAT